MNGSDRLYLQHWIRDRDANAFNELTVKYSGLVYATCLRITRDRTEAEDVTQECFATLSTVARIPRSPLGAWLHRVATNGSLDRIKARNRRVLREAEYARERTASIEIEWKDIDRYVDEAIAELPEKMRAPIVAHFLDGESYTSIAKGLGITRQTVTYRVEKGIGLLRKALKKRGVPVSVTALAAMMASHMATASAAPIATSACLGKMALAGAIETSGASGASAATGVVSGGANLVGGIVMTKSTVVGVGAAVILVSAFVYFITRSETPVEPLESFVVEPPVQDLAALPAEPLEPPVVAPEIEVTNEIESPVEEAMGTGDAFQVRGRVVTTEGAAVVGARLGLYHDTKSWGMDDRMEDETTSDSEGGFFFPALVSFDKFVNHLKAQDTFIIVATHADYAFTWKHVRPAEDHSGYVVTMAPGVSKTITVVDLNNDPIDGALVWPYHVLRDRSDKENNFSIQSGEFRFRSEETNRKGKAIFTQIPDMNVSFHAKKAGYARGLVFYPGDTIVLTRGATVSGRVLTERRKPVVGAVVSFFTSGWYNYMLARTDAEGRYRVTDIPANGFDKTAWRPGKKPFNGEYTVSLRSEEYVAEDMLLMVQLGQHFENVDIRAFAGTLVSCSVVDADSGAPLSGARMLGSDAHRRRLEGYTNEDGLYEVRVFPGEAHLRIMTPPEGMYIPEEESRAQFMAEGDRVEVEFRLDTRRVFTTVTGAVSIPTGNDPAEFEVFASGGRFATSTRFGGMEYKSRLDEHGLFQIPQIPANRSLSLYAISDDRTRAGIASVFVPAPLERAEGLSITLEATYAIEATMTNDDGEPAPNANVRIVPYVDGDLMSGAGWNVKTDENGAYATDGILRGLEYYLWIVPSRATTFSMDDLQEPQTVVLLE